MHLLPELTSGGDTISQAVGMHSYVPSALTESLLFLIVLLGVLITLAAHLLDLLDHNSSLLGSCRTTGILM